MKSCCDEYCSTHGCSQGRNCPVRIKRVEQAKRELDSEGKQDSWLEVIFYLSAALAGSWLGWLWLQAVKVQA
jgi:hypothetical protein